MEIKGYGYPLKDGEVTDGNWEEIYEILTAIWSVEYRIKLKNKCNTYLNEILHMEEEIIGTTGMLVDLFNDNLTQEEWNALCIVHRLSARLDVGIRFDWSKSIDVRSEKYSQIMDESVFLNKESK